MIFWASPPTQNLSHLRCIGDPEWHGWNPKKNEVSLPGKLTCPPEKEWLEETTLLLSFWNGPFFTGHVICLGGGKKFDFSFEQRDDGKFSMSMDRWTLRSHAHNTTFIYFPRTPRTKMNENSLRIRTSSKVKKGRKCSKHHSGENCGRQYFRQSTGVRSL